MNRRTLAIAAAALLLVAGGAAYWLPRAGGVDGAAEAPAAAAPAPRADAAVPQGEAASPGRGPDLAWPARPEAPARTDWRRRPTLGVSLAARSDPARTTPLDRDALRRPEPELEGVVARSQAAWATHLGPLLYAPGHPEQGRWRDSVSLEQAVQAQVDYWREMLPPGHLDEPKLYFVGKISHGLLNQRLDSWDRTSVESSRDFYEWLREQPEDPKAHPFRVWLPADPGDPEVTTRAEDLAERIRRTEAVNFPDDAES